MSDNVELNRENTVLGPQIGVLIGERIIENTRLSFHIQSSIFQLYITAELHFYDNEGIVSYMDAFVRGESVQLVYTGSNSYEVLYGLDMVIDDIIIPETVSPRTLIGDITLKLIPSWVYHQTITPDKIYSNITNPVDVIKKEFGEVQVAPDALLLNQEVNTYLEPRSFYKLKSSMVDFVLKHIMPWVSSKDASSLFLFQILSGGYFKLMSSLTMGQQPLKAKLIPAGISYTYKEPIDNIPIFPFSEKSFAINPYEEDIYNTKSYSIKDNEILVEESKGKIDFSGMAGEYQQKYPSMKSIYFPGNRSDVERNALSQYAKGTLVKRFNHVLTFPDYQVATICDVGSKVFLYDLTLSIPDDSEANKSDHREELFMSPISGEYIVTGSHLYFDGLNEDGFNGAVLEISKLGFDKTNFEGLDKKGAFVQIK